MAILTLDGTLSTATVSTFNGVHIRQGRNNVGYSPYRVDAVVDITASMNLTAGMAGVSTLTNAAPMTLVLPLAAGAAGASYTLRNTTGVAHVISASLETIGSNKIAGFSGSVALAGSKLTMPAVAGASMKVECDGVNWLVIAGTALPAITA